MKSIHENKQMQTCYNIRTNLTEYPVVIAFKVQVKYQFGNLASTAKAPKYLSHTTKN
jgi:hypothetical protein